MIISATVGALQTGDMIFQLVLFLLMMLVIVGIVLVVVRRNRRMKRVEEKLDKLLEEKEKH
ncbi:hypothetical protein ACFOGI_06075 [Virgibacillus xinjiangensis]|uniref:DUF4083 domain-containing protein n=1 Tax=Virgibacillus xinjiangensis TaxID=393090 RepID=A0ABV7CUN9_9BACI